MSSALVLKQTPLFGQLSEDHLARLVELARTQRYSKERVIFNEGDPGAALYVVVRGRIKISQSSPDGKARTLGLLGPGAVFGELAVLDGGARSADAVVLEDAELLTIPRDAFLAFLEVHPQVAMNLLLVLSQRLRRTDQLVSDAAFFDVRGRLARVLLELAQAQGQRESEGAFVCPQLTQTELASLVGVTRESVNKWLRYYERHGTLTRRRGRLVVVDPERLKADII